MGTPTKESGEVGVVRPGYILETWREKGLEEEKDAVEEDDDL